ncbi:hypothetical protein [Microbispora sp. NPDC049633]|uniref:hypothetical protein n=1 Tax=Microbispora sp. NPDC049633 TaxID=3154355 RepID=UPI003426C9D2
MRGLVLITLDGVLRDPANGGPIETGRELYHALSYVYRLAVVVEHVTDEVWLNVNGFDAHQFTIMRKPEDPEDVAIRRLRQVERLRATREDLRLVVDCDPGVITTLFRAGVPCLHYVEPAFLRPDHHPDHDGAITPWEQMVAELDRTRALRAAFRPVEDEA